MMNKEELKNRITKLNNERFIILMADRLRNDEWERLYKIDEELNKLERELKNA